MMKTPDGVELFVRDWPLPPGVRRRGSALIVHGLGEHCGRYAHVAEILNGIGVHVRAYDHRGFGQSGGPRAVIPSRNALVDDAKLVFDALARDAWVAGDTAPPFLIGHSMGGAIAARGVTGGWIKPRGLVLSSPALETGMPRHLRWLVAVASRITPNLAQPHGLPLHRVSHDREVYEAIKRDPHCHDSATPRLVAFILDAGARARRDARLLAVPTLLLVAGDDRLVDPQGAREFADNAPAGMCTTHWYGPLYHEIFNELESDRGRVLDDLRAWIEKQIEAKKN
jgi:alpha-beta hydrolase superfamily lysophospholipase